MMMRFRGRAIVATAIGFTMACSVEDDGRGTHGGGLDPFGVGADSDGATDGDSAGGTDGGMGDDADASDGDDGGGDDDSTVFDLPPPPDGELDEGCTAVDFLFVIDNSISMQEQQNKLKAAFPGFIETIEQTLPTADYHIMVADTDAWGRCDTPDWNGSNPNHEACNDYIQDTSFEQCDRTRGAGVVHPAGEGATNGVCALQGGNRYIVQGQPDLAGTFSCMASVGLAGHPEERAMDGIVRAVSAGHNGPGGCNEGFLRDDAILVVTFISDDGQNVDTNTPQEAYDKVILAKNGNPDAVVMLGLVNNGQTHWLDFISKFGDHGLQAPVNGTDYNAFFLDAVSTIEGTCLDYEG